MEELAAWFSRVDVLRDMLAWFASTEGASPRVWCGPKLADPSFIAQMRLLELITGIGYLGVPPLGLYFIKVRRRLGPHELALMWTLFAAVFVTCAGTHLAERHLWVSPRYNLKLASLVASSCAIVATLAGGSYLIWRYTLWPRLLRRGAGS